MRSYWKRLMAVGGALMVLLNSAIRFPVIAETKEATAIEYKNTVVGTSFSGASATDDRYAYWRIPGILVTSADTVITYYEARANGTDYDGIDLIAYRSTDGGDTFGEPIVLAEGASSGTTINNPVMFDGGDGVVHLLYCVNYGVCTICNDAATSACAHGSGVFYRKSVDDGATWGAPVNITDAADPELHDVIATGPGHGIRLSNGTLVVPVWMVLKDRGWNLTAHGGQPGAVQVSTLYSTDDGATWQLGELVPHDETVFSLPNETSIVETFDGRVMLNIRLNNVGYRAISYSENGYSGWSQMRMDTTLIDPTCFGSMARYTAQNEDEENVVLFANCESSTSRVNLTVKASADNGHSWKYRKVIATHAVGYSDMAVDSDGTIYVLYEVSSGQYCRLARLNYDTLVSDGVTSLASLQVDGAADELNFNGNTDYTLSAAAGSVVTIKAQPYYSGTTITINGHAYTAGEAYQHTVNMSGDPVTIVVSFDGESTTYTVGFIPVIPEKSKVFHLDGTSFNDTSLCSNQLSSTNVTLSSEVGKFGNGSYYFDGTASLSDEATVGVNPGAEDFTVALWINPTTLSSYQHILFWFGAYANGQIFLRTNNTKLQLITKSPGVSETVIGSADCLKKDEWQHIAVTRDGKLFTIYVNGTAVATGQSVAVHDYSAGDGLTIGCARNSTDYRYFKGYMDEFMVYNYAMAARQIADLMVNNAPSVYESFITEFAVAGTNATIVNEAISAVVPSSTDLTALIPTIAISEGATIVPAIGTPQDFTSPVIYTVTAADGQTTTYTVTVVHENNENLLISGGFDGEDPDADWYILGGEVEVGVGRGGTNGLVKGETASANYADSYLKGQNFRLTPNRYYEFSLYFKGAGSTGNVWYNTGSNSNNNVDVVPVSSSLAITEAEDGWKYYRCVLKTGEDPRLAENYALSLTFASGTIVDDVSLRLLPPLSSVSLTEPEKELAAGTSTTIQYVVTPSDAYIGSAVWASSDNSVATVSDGVITAVGEGKAEISVNCNGMQSTCTVSVTSYGNIIVNGDFESGITAEWKNCQNIIQGAGKDGGYALKFSGTTQQEIYYGAPFFGKLESNTTYRLMFDYKNEGGGYPELYVNFGGNSTSVNGENFLQTVKLSGAKEGWQTYITTFTTSDIAYTCSQWELSFIRRVNSNVANGAQGSTYFDNFSVVKTGGVYAPGSESDGSVTVSDGTDSGWMLSGVAPGTRITVTVTPAEGKMMIPGSLQYVASDGTVRRILNKADVGFGAGKGDRFAFDTPTEATTVRITAEFCDATQTNFAVETLGTSLYYENGASAPSGVRFLNRLCVEDLAVDGEHLTVRYQGLTRTITEFGTLLKRSDNAAELTLETVNANLDGTGATRMWKAVAYTAGGDMKLVDYTQSYLDFTVVMKKGTSLSQDAFEQRLYTVCGYVILDDGTVLYTDAMTDSVSAALGRLAS